MIKATADADTTLQRAIPKFSSDMMGHVFCISIIGLLLKQLRTFGESVGIFEITALVCAVTFMVRDRNATMAGTYFGRAVAIITGSFLCGALTSAILFPEHFSVRNLVATLYVMFILFGWLSYTTTGFAEKTERLRNYLAAYCAVVLMLAILAYPVVPWLWYFDTYFGRLMGLSDNPNQLASLCVSGIALTVLVGEARGFAKVVDWLAFGVLTIAGILSLSATFVFSVTLASGVGMASIVRFRVKSDLVLRRLSIIAGGVAVLSVMIVIGLYGQSIVESIVDLYEGGTGKGVVRLTYWLSALAEVLNSPLVGFGPGAHVRAEHTTELQEAHNIFIELLLSGGLIAEAVFMLILLVGFKLGLKRRRPAVLFALTALVVLGSFHTVLRHATYWIALYGMIACAMRQPVAVETRNERQI